MLRTSGSAFAATVIVLSALPAHASEDWFAGTAATNWNGIYVGANAGYAWNGGDHSNITVLDPQGVPYATGPLGYSIDLDGSFGGGQIGYNYSFAGLVVGVEADIEAANIDGSSGTAFAPPVVFPFTYDASTEINWFGTVRGRVGVDFGPTLVYFTGGFAFGEVEYSATYLIPQNAANARLHKSGTQNGYVLGGGVEHQINSNWSLKAEYQYLNLGDEDVSGDLFFANGLPSGETVTSRYDAELHTVRIGLNFRFGRDEPVAVPLK